MNRRIWLAAVLFTSLLAAPLALSAPVHAADQAGNDGISVDVVIPAAGEISVSDAQLRWGLNQEVTSGAFFGGCNFLSAGRAGNTGSSRVWTEQDGFYSAEEGNTRIEKPLASGAWVTDAWATKCQGTDGAPVGTSATERGTGAQAVLDGGVGTIDAGKREANIAWTGSFTVAMYGGMSYWSVSDPVLNVADGKGTLRAVVSGYAADRNDSTSWSPVPEQTVTLASLPNVALGEKGIITQPAYLKVQAERVDPAQDRNSTNLYWGAFPQDFLDFQGATGQGAYWYSSGGLRDPAKVASTLYISYSADLPVATPETEPAPPATAAPAAPSEPPAGGSAGLVVPGASTAAKPPAAAAAPGSVAGSSSVPGTVRTATTPVAQAMNWLGGSLIPQAVDLAKQHREALLWSFASLLALSSFSWIGFRRGWLQLPFRATDRS